MKLSAMLAAGVLAAGTLVGIAEPASAQYYRHGYNRAYDHRGYGDGYRHGYRGYRHGYYGGRHYGWRGHDRWHGRRGYYRHHGYYR